GFSEMYQVQDDLCLSCEHGRSSDDARNRFVTSFVLELPVGRGRRWLTNTTPVVDGFLGGWQVSGINTEMGGMPWSSLVGGNTANIEISGQSRRANRICN